MNESEKQFSFTRAASSTSGRAKNQIPIGDLLQQRKTIKALNQSAEGLLAILPGQDLVTFFDRQRVFGESPTLQWLVAKYGKQ